MPIFEYKCNECGYEFEALIERWNGRCPKCESENLTKKFSTFTFNFRGAFEYFNEEEK